MPLNQLQAPKPFDGPFDAKVGMLDGPFDAKVGMLGKVNVWFF